MTVGDLIEALKEFPKDRAVLAATNEAGTTDEVVSVSQPYGKQGSVVLEVE